MAMVCYVLRTELDRADGGDEPLCLRLPFAGGLLVSDALRVVSGTWCPSLSYCGDVRRELRSLWSRALERTGGRLWVAAYDARSRFPWSERVVALARQAPMPSDQTECVVCMETYEALLPGPPVSAVSRGPSGRWGCLHALCTACDAHIAHSPNTVGVLSAVPPARGTLTRGKRPRRHRHHRRRHRRHHLRRPGYSPWSCSRDLTASSLFLPGGNPSGGLPRVPWRRAPACLLSFFSSRVVSSRSRPWGVLWWASVSRSVPLLTSLH